MDRAFVVAPQAVADIEQAIHWYESKRPGLGNLFLISIESTLVRVRWYPHMHEAACGAARRAVLHRFPHAVYYRVKPDVIELIAVFHCRTSPYEIAQRVSTP
jgi:plasmid stabilization system protein ParE